MSFMSFRQNILQGSKWLLVASTYLLATVIYLSFDLSELSRSLAPDLGDPVFNLFLLDWGSQQLLALSGEYWNAPIFHPMEGATLLSDHLLQLSALSVGLKGLGLGRIAAYNVLLVASFPLTATATAWVLRRAGLGFFGAWVGGAAFAFSPYRFDHLAHLQILFAPWIPIVLWSFHRWISAPSLGRSVAFAGAYTLHVTCGNYLAYMVHFALLAILIQGIWDQSHGWRIPAAWRSRTAALLLLATTGLCGSMAFLVYRPYTEVGVSTSPPRTVEDWQRWGAVSTSFLSPGPNSRYPEAWKSRFARRENNLFPGLLVVMLAGIGIWTHRQRVRRLLTAPPRNYRRAIILALLCAGLALAVGLADARTLSDLDRFRLLGFDFRTDGYINLFSLACACIAGILLLHRRNGSSDRRALLSDPQIAWERSLLTVGLVCAAVSLPLFWVPLTNWLPGLDRMRVPARLFPFVSLAIAAMAGRGVEGLLNRLPKKRSKFLASGALGALLLFEMAPTPPTWHALPSVEEVEPLYTWLRQAEQVSAVFHLPMGRPWWDLDYLYHQPFHGHPIVNGYSGHFPKHYRRLQGMCCESVPDAATLQWLRSHGVSHLAIHFRPYYGPWKREAIRNFEKTEGVEVVYSGADGRAFRIAPTEENQTEPTAF